MKKSWGLIPKILSGEKTIESRWYQTKRAPWDKVKPGDTVYFKNSSEPVTAKAQAGKVLQFQIHQFSDIEHIISRYGKQICMTHKDLKTWGSQPRYCILIFLKNPQSIKPWIVNKTGFGNAAAWLSSPTLVRLQK